MASKTYTNVILTVIAVLLAGLLFKGLFETTANKVYAGDQIYKEYRALTTTGFHVDRIVQEQTKAGWKPISMTQTQKADSSYPDITIIFGK